MGRGWRDPVRTGRHRDGRHGAHGDRDPHPQHVRLLARGDGRMTLLLQLEIDQLNAACAAALDERRFDDWPLFFIEEGLYKVQARENFDRGLPLSLLSFES